MTGREMAKAVKRATGKRVGFNPVSGCIEYKHEPRYWLDGGELWHSAASECWHYPGATVSEVIEWFERHDLTLAERGAVPYAQMAERLS